MMTKYAPNFAALTAEQAAYTAAAVARRHDIPFDGSVSGDTLFSACGTAGLSQANVVMSMARDPSALAVVCLEKLVGRPLRRTPEEKPAKPRVERQKGAAVRRSDPRKIVEVAPNPKKSGSKSHARYEFYRVGMTIDEFIAAGGTTADIRHDTAAGYIKMEEK